MAPAGTTLDERFAARTPMLAGCSTGTRLHLESPLPTDDALGLVPTLEDDVGVRAVRAVAASYAAIAGAFDLPILVEDPTWWARTDRLTEAGRDPDSIDEVVARCVAAVAPLRTVGGLVHVGAPLGPSTDGYRAGAVDPGAAEAYHRRHVDALAATPVEFLSAATFSTTDDLAAAARALQDTSLPYLLGPVVDADGRLADGVALADAIDRVESSLRRPPAHWEICCTHPRVARAALEVLADASPAAHDRVRQIKGNGSDAAGEQREATDRVLSDAAEPWASETFRLLDEHGVTTLGGCCGTDDRHLLSLAIRLARIESAGP